MDHEHGVVGRAVRGFSAEIAKIKSDKLVTRSKGLASPDRWAAIERADSRGGG